MDNQWGFVPLQLQRIEEYDPDAPKPVKSVGDPLHGYVGMSEFMGSNVVELRRNGYIGGEYTHVYRLTESNGAVKFYMASGSMTSPKIFDPPFES